MYGVYGLLDARQIWEYVRGVRGRFEKKVDIGCTCTCCKPGTVNSMSRLMMLFVGGINGRHMASVKALGRSD